MAAADLHTIDAGGISVTVDLAAGHIRTLTVEEGGRVLAPLYSAPWIDEPAIQADETIPPVLRRLSGDFLCAPYSVTGFEGAPLHGWPANAAWTHEETAPHPEGGTVARYRLSRTVAGATVAKELTLRDGHPFLYQRHVLAGGRGALPVAMHAMTRLGAPGRLSWSPKRLATTAVHPLEPDPAVGRHLLAYGGDRIDPAAAPLAAGGSLDLRAYPFERPGEDWVMLVEAPGNPLGWAAALRPNAGDVVLSLKHPARLPMTFLWFSNGGRDYPPWNGRNRGVVGIEEGIGWRNDGIAAAAGRNPLSAAGLPTALRLDPSGSVEIRTVLGGIAAPGGWTSIAAVATEEDCLRVTDVSGESRAVPYDSAFLGA